MTPNITKSYKDTSKFFDSVPPQNNKSDSTANMDGDHSAKTMDQGANAASNAMDQTDGIHEDAKQGTGMGTKETGGGTSIFSKDGAIGGAFTSQGAVGGTAQKIGGPLDKSGAIGKHFNPDGAVGGTFQELAKKNEQH